MTSQPYVVLLTGGAQPGDTDKGPSSLDMDLLAPDRAAAVAALATLVIAGATLDAEDANIASALDRLIAAAWRRGHAEATRANAIPALWVIDGEDTARRFAAFVTAEIDPAIVRRAADPLGQALTAHENNAGRIIR